MWSDPTELRFILHYLPVVLPVCHTNQKNSGDESNAVIPVLIWKIVINKILFINNVLI